MPARIPVRLFLFDLDGTLIDSKSDIARSLNLALESAGLSTLTVNQVSAFVGEGVRVLVTRALREVTGKEPERQLVQCVASQYLREYEAHPLDSTCLLDGVTEALDRLLGASFAVVTNKPEHLSRRILEGLGVGDRFCVIVGGDTIPQRKPDAAPLRAAMARCGASPTETVMVGDSAVDIYAGKAAGVFTCGVTGGFRSREELESAGCDLILSSLVDLADHFSPPLDRK